MLLDYKVVFVLPGCSKPVGLEDGRVQDSQLSSHTHRDGSEALKGRLHHRYRDAGWFSATNNKNSEFFQIDLLNVQHISGVATQGVLDLSSESCYVTTFLVGYSYDGNTWFIYERGGGSVQVRGIICLNLFLV